jgi:hypothetical protein
MCLVVFCAFVGLPAMADEMLDSGAAGELTFPYGTFRKLARTTSQQATPLFSGDGNAPLGFPLSLSEQSSETASYPSRSEM